MKCPPKVGHNFSGVLQAFTGTIKKTLKKLQYTLDIANI